MDKNRLVIFITLGLCWLNVSEAGIPIVNTADEARQSVTKIETAVTLKNMITALQNAQDVHQQIEALKNIQDFSQNPRNATLQLTSIVNNLLTSFNGSSGSSFENLSQLISSLALSTTNESMNIKLNQASNVQLQNITSLLQQLQAEQQILIRYKQAELARQDKETQSKARQDKAISNALKRM